MVRALLIGGLGVGLVWLLTGTGAAAETASGAQLDRFAPIVLLIALIVVAAVLGHGLATWLGQPTVLGELLLGVAIGNVGYALDFGPAVLVMHMTAAGDLLDLAWRADLTLGEAAAQLFTPAEMAPDQAGARLITAMTGAGNGNVLVGVALFLFSNIGLLLLMFMVGLESSVDQMRSVGGAALRVAVLGVVAPFALGYVACELLLPGTSITVHLFVGATLTATSLGITAAVFQELGQLRTRAAEVVLGAAVIDDVLGLLVLAVVIDVVVTGRLHVAEVAEIALISFTFLGTLFVFGQRIVAFGLPLFDLLDRHDCKLLYPLFLCFTIAYLASAVGLAAIVGAFAAGMILSDAQFKGHEGERSMEELVEPLEAMFTPVFFVLMGMQVNLGALLDPVVFLLALALSVVAIAGKLIAGLAAGRGVDRLTVGIGMVPRGEVGLIFAATGKGLGVIGDQLFSALVLLVVVTTVVTPPALKWALARSPKV